MRVVAVADDDREGSGEVAVKYALAVNSTFRPGAVRALSDPFSVLRLASFPRLSLFYAHSNITLCRCGQVCLTTQKDLR